MKARSSDTAAPRDAGSPAWGSRIPSGPSDAVTMCTSLLNTRGARDGIAEAAFQLERQRHVCARTPLDLAASAAGQRHLRTRRQEWVQEGYGPRSARSVDPRDQPLDREPAHLDVGVVDLWSDRCNPCARGSCCRPTTPRSSGIASNCTGRSRPATSPRSDPSRYGMSPDRSIRLLHTHVNDAGFSSLSTFRLKTCFAVCSQEMLDVSALS